MYCDYDKNRVVVFYKQLLCTCKCIPTMYTYINLCTPQYKLDSKHTVCTYTHVLAMCTIQMVDIKICMVTYFHTLWVFLEL